MRTSAEEGARRAPSSRSAPSERFHSRAWWSKAIEVLAVELRRAAWNGFINGVAASGFMPRPLRAAIYRRAGMTIESWNIQPGCYIGPGKLSIGEMSFVNHRCFFDNSAPISIGKHVHVAMEVLFCTSTHEPGTPGRRAGRGTGKRISVGDGAWIGARATILPGVTVGAGAIVAAGAVVSSDCEPHTLYAGVPAEKVRALDSEALEP